ncbi:MAG: primosomal protein N', partial [Bacteroidota bacterium]
QSALQHGGQVLYLLPEIALTTQMVKRLKKIFGDQMGVYHSKYSNNERVEVWNSVLEETFSFVLGVRSAIFLPFNNLSLIIVDEEHETSYKQFNGQPRYHARDAALVLAQYHHAKVLLGSATPSVETYHHAQIGKYGLVALTERFGKATLPTIEFTNLRIERARKSMREDFTTTLLNAITQTLEHQEQVIIFQNRRGYAPYITCEDCAWVPMCARCAVSLTYHQRSNHLRCHYCGYYIQMPPACGVCSSHRLKNVGFGTEKLEETLQLFFPNKAIQRMDLDTTRGKHSYDQIIEALEQGRTDILVGTQMVTKGLDFGRVSLVGVLGIDRLLHFPDFRAGERCFQLITQVSGRAGRRERQGKVIIQTMDPKHPTLEAIAQHDYVQMYERELAERHEFLYPPFMRLIRIILKHRDQVLVAAAAQDLAQRLCEKLGKKVSGPQAPLVSRIKQQYLMELWIKVNKNPAQATAAKAWLRTAARQLLLDRTFKTVKVIFDVDPV